MRRADDWWEGVVPANLGVMPEQALSDQKSMGKPVSWPSVRVAMTGAALLATVLVMLLVGCGSEVDPTPEKIDGTPSYEFEQDDLDAAEEASDAVKEYCADAVSEAQRLGCEAHVTEDEIP
jgi:hypothetical protein